MWLQIRKVWLILGGMALISGQVYSLLQAYGVLPLVYPPEEVGLSTGGIFTLLVGVGFVVWGIFMKK